MCISTHTHTFLHTYVHIYPFGDPFNELSQHLGLMSRCWKRLFVVQMSLQQLQRMKYDCDDLSVVCIFVKIHRS